MSYVVLARKWRPMRFEDLIGQDHVARTLANAIDRGRVAHAFLFTGVRGVGKTTSARILAKALNCMRPGPRGAGQDPGPTATPCLECPACQEIALGTDVDVREIDGASYNGVDEVRKLQDSLPYQPTRDRYKIVIVDEVHMLSQSAWNAFLKTLEEPPPHVKFIFATTEVHKVPITILSRVQRFDFKLIKATAIIERLREVLVKEGIDADEEALSLIARQAAGSMRDAMSLLDQVIAWGGDKLVGKDVALVLGVASGAALHAISRGLVKGDASACLKVISELVEQGYDVNHVAKDLLAMLRDMVVARVCPEPGELLDLSQEERQDIIALAAEASADDLVRLHQGFSQGFDDIARSGQSRAALEMLLVRLCRRPPLLPIDDLIGRLNGLERRLTAGSNASAASSVTGDRGQRTAFAKPRAREQRPSRTSGTADEEPADEPPPARLNTGPRPATANETPAADVAKTLERSSATTVVSQSAPRLQQESKPLLAVEQAAPSGKPGAGASDATSPLGDDQATLASELLRFRELVELIREARPELAAFLEHAVVLKAEAGKLELAYAPGSVFSEQVKGRDCIDLLSDAAGKLFGAPTRAEFRFDYAEAQGMDTLSANRVRAREARMRKAIADAKNHPRVTDALEVFGARLKDLKVSESS